MRFRKFLFIGFACLWGAFSLQAQDAQLHKDELPEFWFVYKNYVKPNQTDSFESVLKDMIGGLAKAKDKTAPSYRTPWFTFVDKSHAVYTQIIPFDDFSSIQQQYESWKKAKKSPQMMTFITNIESMLNKWDAVVLESRRELSYYPENGSNIANNDEFYLIEMMQVEPEAQEFFEKTLKKWVAGFEAHKAPYGWNTYKTLIGENQPLYVMVAGAEKMEDFKKHMIVSLEIGERDKLFSGSGIGVINTYTWELTTYRSDLSYLPSLPDCSPQNTQTSNQK